MSFRISFRCIVNLQGSSVDKETGNLGETEGIGLGAGLCRCSQGEGRWNMAVVFLSGFLGAKLVYHLDALWHYGVG